MLADRHPQLLGHFCVLPRAQMAAAAEEKQRHIDNLKQQSGHFLKRKGEEAAALRLELERLQRESGAEISALKVRAAQCNGIKQVC